MDTYDHIAVATITWEDAVLVGFWECSLCKKETPSIRGEEINYCKACGAKFVNYKIEWD